MSDKHQRCVANFFEIVKGFGMLPDKYAQAGIFVRAGVVAANRKYK